MNINNTRANANNNIGLRPALSAMPSGPCGQGFAVRLTEKGALFLAGRQKINIKAATSSIFDANVAALFERRQAVPKTYGNLWGQIVDIENLYCAYLAARDKKREKSEVLSYDSHREENLIIAQNELIWHTWSPKPYRQFEVHEPKRRLIHAPQFSDRVIHHALVRVIEPLFERKMIFHSFACRKGLGTHNAVATAEMFARKMAAKYGQYYFLKGDIHHYFPSINHEALKNIIRRTIRDKDVLWLINKIIDESGFPGVGLPIGTLTSQLFANVYLDSLDHHMKDVLGVKHYLRYMDDFIVFSNDKGELRTLLNETRQWLSDNLKLQLNGKTRIVSQSEGLDFCGYRIWPAYRLPRKRNVTRMRRRMKKLCKRYRRGAIPAENVKAAWASFLGYMKHCNGHKTKFKIWQELNNLI
ncbi:MAG: reverse transcriptase/maturase family protein [Synergistaceae bacterium]|nr:reverse transcriptase/maturase family protein [Synergistaceae bacterium]